ncbi:MAG TPA: hypothetical protein VHA71_08655 [Rhodanobacteraceae bacterium]|jgi:hypothetical protein|nr:hypothetical protein [Rhodanobacteraceae bacterium]
MPFDEHQLARLLELYPSSNPEALLHATAALGFSVDEYFRTNPDLKEAGLDEAGAAYHYLSCGALHEQRRFNSCVQEGDRSWIAALQVFPLDSPASRMLLVNLMLNRIWSDRLPLDAGHGTCREFLEVCRRKAIRPVLMIGDSHCQAYLVPQEIGTIVHIPLQMVCHGGSAAGLANPDSKSGFGGAIARFFDTHADLIREFELPCFFKFGQVDAEFVWIFKRAQRRETRWSAAGFEAFARNAVARYMDFLERLSAAHGLVGQVRVLSIFPPTLSDASWHKGYVNARIRRLESDMEEDVLSERVRDLSIPTQRERTRLHALWNALVMAECARRGLLYVDDFQALLDHRGLVDDAYTAGHDGADHHLAVAVMGGVVRNIFKRYATTADAPGDDGPGGEC